MGYVSVLSLHYWLHNDTSFGVWHLADIPLYNGKGFRTFLAFEDGLRCRFRHYNHPFKGWKLVLETVYFEGWCTSKQVEKVLKVKLKFRGSKSGRPTDDLLWSSGRPTAILGVRTPGRPLNLHAVHCCQCKCTGHIIKLQDSVSRTSLQINMQNFVGIKPDLLTTKKWKKKKVLFTNIWDARIYISATKYVFAKWCNILPVYCALLQPLHYRQG